ncbi:MAG: hypothetical protein JWM81_430 [Candidatus Saccharibacteria bacterium]|nr:hypothetical protein [Candidatus Saccharibacteria bacterium]
MPINRKLIARSLVAVFGIAIIAPVVLASVANAASLSQVSVRFDRMKISTTTTGTVCAKPSSAGTEATTLVTFPTGYTLGIASTFTVGTTNTAWPTGGTAWPGIATATNVTGQVVTFPSGDLTVGVLYCFNWVNPVAVTVKASATANNTGTVETYIAGPTLLDSSPFSTASIADDQIVVTASVPQAFSFALSGNTDNLGALASGAVSSSPTPRTVTINTNAASGWNLWARDVNTGLLSASATKTIASTTPGTNSTLSAGTEGYNTGVTSANGGGTGVITVTAPFVGGSAGKGGGLNTSFASMASANGTATGHVLSLTTNAAVAGATPAATDYTDTITVVGAASF